MASSQYREIGLALAAEIAAVEDVGQVHTRHRDAADLQAYLDHFRWKGPDGQDRIRGWVVTRESAREEPGSFAGSGPGGGFTPAGVNRRTHVFLIFGVQSFEEATGSEEEFQELIERICDRFRDNRVLRLRDAEGEVRVSTLERLHPPQVELIELRAFGPVLCHYAEIRIQAIERVTRS